MKSGCWAGRQAEVAGAMKFATTGVQAPRSPFVFKPISALWLVALFGVGAAAEATGERFALVVGNGAYQDAPLANARNDAEDIAALLREIGFSVDLAVEVGRADFGERISAFAERTRGADAALFFYAGHGMQVDGTNHLLPVDAELRAEIDLEFKAVSLESVLKGMRGAANLVFLDACRNNPFASRVASSMGERSATVGRGLAPVERRNTHGTYIAFATAAGEIAADGEGENSPFTAALKKHLPTPGLTVDSVMTRVRDELAVRDQVPWSNTSLRKEFYFVPPNPDPPPKPATESGMDPEEEEWRFVRDSGNPQQVRDFLERHPNGRFAGAAQALLARLSGWPFTVETEPLGARVKLVGHAAPYRADMRLPAGEYRVEVTAEGHETRTVTVRHGGSPTTHRVVLRRAKPKILDRFRDPLSSGGLGPLMVVVPAGEFAMGSPPNETGRFGHEGPVRRVRVARPFAVGVYEVTVSKFRRFVDTTGHPMGHCECDNLEPQSLLGWRHPGFPQDGSHPVVCVSWNDARSYAAWLSRETGESYRLPTEWEWEYVARARTTSARHWGGTESGQCRHGNGADQGMSQAWKLALRQWQVSWAACDDGYEFTAPVGTYRKNGWGLHDVLGNASEWTADCGNWNVPGARTGRAWEKGNCAAHINRGGSWSDAPQFLRSASRRAAHPACRAQTIGFRVARTIGANY